MKKGKRNQSLLLKVDEKFTPALVEDGEEFFPSGYFFFNITKMRRYIISHKDRFKISDISVLKYRSCMAALNEDHIDKVNIESPVIASLFRRNHWNSPTKGIRELSGFFKKSVSMFGFFLIFSSLIGQRGVFSGPFGLF